MNSNDSAVRKFLNKNVKIKTFENFVSTVFHRHYKSYLVERNQDFHYAMTEVKMV
jgi:hypothetical protein